MSWSSSYATLTPFYSPILCITPSTQVHLINIRNICPSFSPSPLPVALARRCRKTIDAMPLDTGSEPPRKKQRTAKSCEQCRHRKVRCDQRFPCGPCCRSRGRLSCAYRSLPGDAVSARDLQPGPVAAAATAAPGAATTTTAVTPATAAGGASGSSQAPPAHDRPARASTSGNHVGRVGQSAGGLRASSSSFPRIGASDHTVDLLKRLEVRIQRVEDQAGRELHARDGGESAEPESLRVAPVVPRFRFSQDKVRIFGEAHWMHAMSKVRFESSICRCLYGTGH